jgi:predicted ArsR family transcriptional regulator
VNQILATAEGGLRTYVRKWALGTLFRATARAFGRQPPRITGLAAEVCVARYAAFTQSEAEALLRNGGDVHAVEERLYGSAYRLGRACRWASHARTTEEALTLARALYRALDIDLTWDEKGEVLIRHCALSGTYSPETCRLMSAMDKGLVSGLSAGGALTFTARITEGQPCCRVRLELHGRKPG